MNHNSEHQIRSNEPVDEVSLDDIYRIVVKRRLVLFATFSAVMLVAAIYLALAEPVYEAKVRLLPVMDNSVSLTQPDHVHGTYSATVLLSEFQIKLTMIEQWREFVSSNPDLFPSPEISALRDSTTAHPLQLIDNKDHVLLTYQDNDPERSAEILRRYLRHSQEKYVEDLIFVLNSKLERERVNTTQDIAMMRKKAKLEREDSIQRLRRDLSEAKSLGIHDFHYLQPGEFNQSGSVVIAASASMPGYMRGTKFLSEELDSLLNRESDDAYIVGLRDKEIDLERLNALRIVPEKFHPYRQDGKVYAPRFPIKPRMWTSLSLSAILGVALALFGTIVVEFISKSKRTDGSLG